jgi:hypothetical protein
MFGFTGIELKRGKPMIDVLLNERTLHGERCRGSAKLPAVPRIGDHIALECGIYWIGDVVWAPRLDAVQLILIREEG